MATSQGLTFPEIELSEDDKRAYAFQMALEAAKASSMSYSTSMLLSAADTIHKYIYEGTLPDADK